RCAARCTSTCRCWPISTVAPVSFVSRRSTSRTTMRSSWPAELAQAARRNLPKHSTAYGLRAPKPSSCQRWQIAMTPADFRAAALERTRGVLVELDEPFGLLLVALLVGGNTLVEGVPGTAKTLMA